MASSSGGYEATREDGVAKAAIDQDQTTQSGFIKGKSPMWRRSR